MLSKWGICSIQTEAVAVCAPRSALLRLVEEDRDILCSIFFPPIRGYLGGKNHHWVCTTVFSSVQLDSVWRRSTLRGSLNAVGNGEIIKRGREFASSCQWFTALIAHLSLICPTPSTQDRNRLCFSLPAFLTEAACQISRVLLQILSRKLYVHDGMTSIESLRRPNRDIRERVWQRQCMDKRIVVLRDLDQNSLASGLQIINTNSVARTRTSG